MSQATTLDRLKELLWQIAQADTPEAAAQVVGEWLLAAFDLCRAALFGVDAESERWRVLWQHGLADPDALSQFSAQGWPLHGSPWQDLPCADCAEPDAVRVQPLLYGDERVGVLWICLGGAENEALRQADTPGRVEEMLDGGGAILAAKLKYLVLERRTRQEMARLQARSEQLAVLNRIAQALAATLDPGELCRIAHREIGQLLDCPNLGISTYDDEQQMISPLYLIGDGVHIDSSHIQPVPLEPETGTQSKVIVSKQPLLIPDLEALRGEIKTFHRIETSDRRAVRAAMVAPMVAGDRVIGTLQIQSYSPGIYTQEDVDLLWAIANQLGIALENGLLYASAQKRLRDLETINRMYATLRMTKDLDTLIPLLLDETLACIQLDTGAIWLQEAGSDVLTEKASRGWFARLPAKHMQASEGITGEVFTSGKISLTREYAQSQAIQASTRPGAPPGWGGAAFPLRADDGTIGVLHVAVEQPRFLTQEEVRLISILCEIAGAAIHRAALYDKIEAQAQRLQEVVDTVQEGLILLDAQHHVILANPAALPYLAVLAGIGLGDRLTHLADHELSSLLKDHSDGGRTLDLVIEAPEPRIFEMGSYALDAVSRSKSKTVDGWVILLREVTEARRNQEQVEAQARLAAVGQMAAGIAHDFNNILAVIVLVVEMLQKTPDLPESAHRRLTTIYEQSKHAASLIQQILDFSRRAVIQRAKVDLTDLLAQEVSLLQRTMPDTIHVVSMMADRPLFVLADATRLRQIVANLAVNARHAMPQGGVLSFTLDTIRCDAAHPPPVADMADGVWVQLSVQDTGEGIRPDHLSHIFEPFFTTKAPGQGTGLGLAQVYGIIKQHGGHITVESQLDQGTLFSLYLPTVKG